MLACLAHPRRVQTAMSFRVIQNALSVIVTQMKTLASLASEVERLHYLVVTMDGIKDSVSREGFSHPLAARDETGALEPFAPVGDTRESERTTVLQKNDPPSLKNGYE